MTALLDHAPPTPRPDPAPPAQPRRPAWTRRRPDPDLSLVAGLVLVVVAVQGWNITGYPIVGDDEGTYLSQAWAVQNGAGLAPYTYWYDHPPLGWIQLATLSWIPGLLFPGELAVAYGRLVMLVVSATSAALVYLLGRRLQLPRWGAAPAVLLFALSPLSVTLHRQVFLDNLGVAWALGAMVLALSPRKHLWHHVGAGVCFAVAVLSKETILLVLPAVLLAVWQGSHPSTRTFSFTGFVCGLGLVGVGYPLYAVLRGELLPGDGHVSLVGASVFQVADRKGSGSVFSDGSVSSDLVESWLFYDSVLVLAGCVAVLAALAVRRLRVPAVAGLVLVLMVLRPGGYLPAMYVVQALPFFALCIAGVAATVVGAAVARRRAAAEPPRRAAWTAAVVACTVLAVLAAVTVVPRWTEGNLRAMTAAENAPYTAAARWVEANVPDPGRRRIVVDNALWLDMVETGFEPGTGAIWFYKLDLDPAVSDALPGGWRDVDWIVSTPVIREYPENLPTVVALLEHSETVATFGAGEDRIEVRRVQRTGR